MEISIIHNNLRASEIKPSSGFGRYKDLLVSDSAKIIKTLHHKTCPACKSASVSFAFEKFSFEFMECDACFSLFANKMPDQAALYSFYRESIARDYWFEVISAETSSVRVKKIYEPALHWIEGHLSSDDRLKHSPVVEVYPLSPGFSAYWGSHCSDYPYLMNEVLFNQKQSVGQEKRIVSSMPDNCAAVCAFDALQHQVDPIEFLNRLAGHIQPGGFCFLTSVVSSGFDVMSLGAASDLILPPERLRLFSVEGIERIIKDSGCWEVVELSTPGQLDFEYVRSAVINKTLPNRFANYLVKCRGGDPDFGNQLSEMLQRWRLSSHCRVVVKKKDK